MWSRFLSFTCRYLLFPVPIVEEFCCVFDIVLKKLGCCSCIGFYGVFSLYYWSVFLFLHSLTLTLSLWLCNVTGAHIRWYLQPCSLGLGLGSRPLVLLVWSSGLSFLAMWRMMLEFCSESVAHFQQGSCVHSINSVDPEAWEVNTLSRRGLFFLMSVWAEFLFLSVHWKNFKLYQCRIQTFQGI